MPNIAGADKSPAAYAAKIGAVIGLFGALTDIAGWRGQVLQPWDAGGTAENLGYFLGATFVGAVAGAIIGATFDFFRNIRATSWRNAGRVALWLLAGAALLIWSLADWESARWIIGIGAALYWGSHLISEYEARKLLEQDRAHARQEKQNEMLAEILARLRRMDRDRGYPAD